MPKSVKELFSYGQKIYDMSVQGENVLEINEVMRQLWGALKEKEILPTAKPLYSLSLTANIHRYNFGPTAASEFNVNDINNTLVPFANLIEHYKLENPKKIISNDEIHQTRLLFPLQMYSVKKWKADYDKYFDSILDLLKTYFLCGVDIGFAQNPEFEIQIFAPSFDSKYIPEHGPNAKDMLGCDRQQPGWNKWWADALKKDESFFNRTNDNEHIIAQNLRYERLQQIKTNVL